MSGLIRILEWNRWERTSLVNQIPLVRRPFISEVTRGRTGRGHFLCENSLMTWNTRTHWRLLIDDITKENPWHIVIRFKANSNFCLNLCSDWLGEHYWPVAGEIWSLNSKGKVASYTSCLQKTLNDANLLFLCCLSEMRWSTTSTVVIIGFSWSPLVNRSGNPFQSLGLARKDTGCSRTTACMHDILDIRSSIYVYTCLCFLSSYHKEIKRMLKIANCLCIPAKHFLT